MKLGFTWQPRAVPLVARAVFIPADKIQPALQRLLQLDAEHLAMLEGVICEVGMVIFGKQNKLPWVDGCVYLAIDKQAPHLYISTLFQPSLPLTLLDKAVYKKWQQVVALLPETTALIPLQSRKKLSLEKLKHYATP